MIRWIAPIVVSILVVLMFGAVLGLILSHPLTMDQTTFAILNLLLGTLAAGFTTVVQYWLGSSSGSKAKDATVESMTETKKDLPAS